MSKAHVPGNRSARSSGLRLPLPGRWKTKRKEEEKPGTIVVARIIEEAIRQEEIFII
ncbi:MAG: hypothetical protein KAR40_00105 [Candidatus Sabulitectum sp.]|nr:hypothetical protein [Candidatus Sabulitectum sp.]